jgi:uncharacterized protein YbjT (DUF2867 family)
MKKPVQDLRIILFGASGMVGAAVLSECLKDPKVKAVLSVGRKPCGMSHAKLKELLIPDLFKLESSRQKLKGYNVCLFTVGASATGLNEEGYTKINHDLPIKTAKLLLKLNKTMSICYVSGGGTDSTEKGPIMWARVKGRTENDLFKLPFRAAVMFRLGGLQPLKGFKSSTKLYRVAYDLIGPLIPLLVKLFPQWVTTPERLGRAMLRAARGESSKNILESKDIHEFGSINPASE